MSYDNIQRGEYSINGKVHYFRSKWEANYALYLDFLKGKGQIKDWKYENKIFEFPVKHGTTRYMPDFEITQNNGELTYDEVKGFLTPKAKTQLKRMAKYYPKVKVTVVDREFMKALNRFSKLLNFY